MTSACFDPGLRDQSSGKLGKITTASQSIPEYVEDYRRSTRRTMSINFQILRSKALSQRILIYGEYTR
jgi:hypothetical protein